MANIIKVTDETFDSTVTKSQLPCLVFFTAVWSSECRQTAPIFLSLSGEFIDKVIFAEIDIETSPNAPRTFNVMNLPLFIMFKEGKEVARITGVMPKSKLEEFINKAL